MKRVPGTCIDTEEGSQESKRCPLLPEDGCHVSGYLLWKTVHCQLRDRAPFPGGYNPKVTYRDGGGEIQYPPPKPETTDLSAELIHIPEKEVIADAVTSLASTRAEHQGITVVSSNTQLGRALPTPGAVPPKLKAVS